MTTDGLDADLFKRVPDGALASDPETGEILAVNEKLCELLGVEQSAVRGTTLSSHTATGHRMSDSIVGSNRLSQPDDGPVQWTWPLETASEDVFLLAAHSTVVTVDDVDVVLTTVRPISERPERETELAEARTRYRRILDHLSDYVVILSEPGVIEYASPGVEETLGYAPDAVVGTDAFEYVVPEDRERVRSAFVDQLETPGAEHRVDYRVRASDGSIKWTEARGGNYLDDPLIDGIMVTIRDVTERKQRERTLSYRTALFEAVTESIDAGVLVVGTDREILWYNAQFREMWDLPKEVLKNTVDNERAIEQVLDTVVNPERFREATEELYEPPYEAARTEIELIDGRWFDRYTAPVVDEDGTRYGLLSLTRDVTDRKRYETRIETQNRRLERLADVIAHDIQTPLSTATKLLQLLELELEEPDESVAEPIARLGATLDRLESFADHLPRLARESTDVETAVECSLADIAADAWAVTDTGDLELELGGDRTLAGDPTRLQQLFENLFGNVREYGVERVHGEATATTVWIEPTETGFAVADDGPGVPESVRDDIFEYGVSTGDGAGIGLAIVRTIVEAHGWSIRVTDGPSGGAKFVVDTT
ncbi:PAS domain S-box protein [Halostella salina]|uniref:PAS domain S-box protein n=1 Tax=Halostella salina TaxID=1547897 RepID=UPI000EF7717D|nr:PAS domain S-box protein [Halostella salina]